MAANDREAAAGLAMAFAADDATDRKMEKLLNASAIFEDSDQDRYQVGPVWSSVGWAYGVIITYRGDRHHTRSYTGGFSNHELATKQLFKLAEECKWTRVENSC